MFDLNDYLFRNRRGMLSLPIHPIKCKSGLTMSVQASIHHYCQPRNDDGPYQQVEVGFPSRQIDDLMQYAENPAIPTETVYAYVPTTLVEQIVNDNGGLV